MILHKFGFSDKKMMFKNEISSFTEESISRCHFSPLQKTDKLYTCYNFESCCENGCCITILRRIFQFWYFWLLVVVVCVVVLSCGQYYKRMKILRDRQLIRRENRAVYLSERVFYRPREDLSRHCLHQNVLAEVQSQENFAPFRCLEQFDRPSAPNGINNLLYEHLIASITQPSRSQHSLFANLPPDYSTIEKDPIYTEEPPGYLEACELLKANNKDVSDESVLENENLNCEEGLQENDNDNGNSSTDEAGS